MRENKNYDIILYFLKLNKNEFSTEDYEYNILIDHENALSRCSFTEKQSKVLALWRLGLNVNEIAEYLNVNHSTVTRHLDAIAKKIQFELDNMYIEYVYKLIHKVLTGKGNKYHKQKLVEVSEKYDIGYKELLTSYYIKVMTGKISKEAMLDFIIHNDKVCTELSIES